MSPSEDWFNRYKFCQPLGQGGMGMVYLAEDKANGDSRCVIKQLISKPSDKDEQAEAIRLFQREAEILRHLNHPGVVRVFDDHATADGKYFLVMDYIPGRNLDAIINAYGPFNSEATVEIAIQCCEVLEYLHELPEPIIYRDLKPSNLMLTPDGKVVFIDFGIARSFVPKENATRVVTTGYSPPEQYFGKPELKSDLYALGATLGNLLTGKKPKPLAESAPKLLDPSVMTSLDALVKRLTAHNPDDRPESARKVRYELYYIYKEIHPEFQIPIEARSQTSKPGTSSGLTATARKGANKPLRHAITEDKLRGLVQKSVRETNVVDFVPVRKREQPQSFWERVKNWIDIHTQ